MGVFGQGFGQAVRQCLEQDGGVVVVGNRALNDDDLVLSQKLAAVVVGVGVYRDLDPCAAVIEAME